MSSFVVEKDFRVNDALLSAWREINTFFGCKLLSFIIKQVMVFFS